MISEIISENISELISEMISGIVAKIVLGIISGIISEYIAIHSSSIAAVPHFSGKTQQSHAITGYASRTDITRE